LHVPIRVLLEAPAHRSWFARFDQETDFCGG
jgi:hypothetical protein